MDLLKEYKWNLVLSGFLLVIGIVFTPQAYIFYIKISSVKLKENKYDVNGLIEGMKIYN